MKTLTVKSTRQRVRPVLTAALSALVIAMALPVANDFSTPLAFDLIPSVQADESHHDGGGGGTRRGAGQAQRGGAGGSGKYGSGSGQGHFSGSHFGGGGGDLEAAGDDDGDDSDRPSWAGTKPDPDDPDTKRPGGGGNATPGVSKGDEYGDLWVILRDDNGDPILDENGQVQPILEDGTVIQLVEAEDGKYELPAGVTAQEVELGRTNLARAPERVILHALDEALSKVDGTVIDSQADLELVTDESGRLLVFDGDVVIAAIDSPLENLAIFQALVASYDGGTSTITSGDYTLTVVGADLVYELAASALAAANDKTDTFSVDQVVILSDMLGVTGELQTLIGDASDYAGAAAEYGSETVNILVQTAGQDTPDDITDDVYEVQVKVLSTIDFSTLDDTVEEGLDPDNYLDDAFDNDGITGFTQAADDALQVLEYVHDYAVD